MSFWNGVAAKIITPLWPYQVFLGSRLRQEANTPTPTIELKRGQRLRHLFRSHILAWESKVLEQVVNAGLVFLPSYSQSIVVLHCGTDSSWQGALIFGDGLKLVSSHSNLSTGCSTCWLANLSLPRATVSISCHREAEQLALSKESETVSMSLKVPEVDPLISLTSPVLEPDWQESFPGRLHILGELGSGSGLFKHFSCWSGSGMSTPPSLRASRCVNCPFPSSAEFAKENPFPEQFENR